MKRVLALAVACLLMAGALAVRNVLTDDDDDGDTDGGEEGDLVIACIPELEAACRALEREVAELRIEDPAATIEDPDVDAWITLDPWPAMVELETGTSPFPGAPVPVAATDLVLIAREDQVPSTCETVTWTCLVDQLGDLVAVPDPDSASGRLVLGHAAVDFFGPGLASNDFADPGFSDRLAALSIGGEPLEDIAVGLPEPVATGSLVVQLAELGNRRESFVESPGAQPATVAVVVAGRQADRVHGEPSFTEALAELGWEILPDAATTGLPDAGVLLALAQEVGS
jgi:hypothetical protein